MDEWILFILLILVALVSLAAGIFLLIQYSKTRNKWFLSFGILLTFIIPPIVLYAAIKNYPSPLISYGPGSPMAYGPAPT